MRHNILISLILLSTLSLSTKAAAQDGVALNKQPSLVGWDVEIDPLAYALKGHSLHVGLWLKQWRLDLGSFGLTVPSWVHGQEGFTQSFSGFGMKLDYFINPTQDGIFLGLETGLARTTIRQESTGLSDTLPVLNAGGRVGYRWTLGEHFFVSPWVGVGYAFGARDSVLGDAQFSSQRITIFPTIHVGYQIQ
jgi:hypothetical protein